LGDSAMIKHCFCSSPYPFLHGHWAVERHTLFTCILLYPLFSMQRNLIEKSDIYLGAPEIVASELLYSYT